MSAPQGPVPVPAVVAEIAGDRAVTAVWVNELGGVTYAIGSQPPAEYVKVYPDAAAHLLADEAPRLRWARCYAGVPTVIDAGPGWLHTRGTARTLGGGPAVGRPPRGGGAGDRRGSADAARRAAGRGLPVRTALLGACGRTIRRPAGGVPRRRLRAQHVDSRRRPVQRARRPRRLSGSPTGGPTWRWRRCRWAGTTPSEERLGGRPARRVRRDARPRAHRLLPRSLERRSRVRPG